MSINWHYPEPRTGMTGWIDKFIGPGATRSEILLQTAIPVIAAIAAILYGVWINTGWSPFQQCLCCLIAIDVVGGIVTNATSSAKRWYHRPGQKTKQHMGFILLHFFQLLLVSWFFLSFDVVWIAVSGIYMTFAALVITSSALYLQRPIAMIFYSGSLLLSLYVLKQPLGLEWFLPMFYLKLLLSHLPKEEPYRPNDEL